MTNIAWLKDINENEKGFVGVKAGLLADIYSIAPIPNGFVIKSVAFDHFVGMHVEKLRKILADSLEDEDKSLQIQDLFSSLQLPNDMANDIFRAYAGFGMDYHTVKSAFDLVKSQKEQEVVVRTELFVGDEAFASNSELPVKGTEALLKAIKSSWKGLFSADTVEFLNAEGVDIAEVKVAVLVQELVQAHKAGIAYSVNPDTGESNEIAIEACWGLADYFMCDECEPNFYILDKAGLSIKEKKVEPQKYVYIVDSKTGDMSKKMIPEEEQNIKVLKDDEILKIAEITKRIEEHFSEPVEVEFAVEKGRVFILQVEMMEESGEEVEEETEPEAEETMTEDVEIVEADMVSCSNFEQELHELIEKYITINSNLKDTFLMLETDILELFRRF
ncbi:MAG: PEP/pyruvate-binding domain-containing protein [Candidatus Woesearchaeota archaeon]